MSKKSTYLLGILLTIVVGSLLYWYLCCSVCCEKQSCDVNKTSKEGSQDNVAKPKVKKPTFIPFSVNDANGDFKFSIDESFNFNESNFVINNTVSEKLNKGILNIKEYLDANGDKRFNITGYYTSNETNNSAFPNLGLARANSVKNYMKAKGISSKVINTFGGLKDDIVSDKNKDFLGPLSFDIFTRTDEATLKDKELKEICETIKENPLKLYFDSGKAHINLSKEQREKFTSISSCIDKLGMIVQVIGHTDNTGNSENNMKLGKKRADFVKDYLVQNGILKDNIETSSKGQNEPIANNATKEGRVKNRRIVITITKKIK
jgi:outer membrane protein OmpA-like peptidoglycan-associated protein